MPLLPDARVLAWEMVGYGQSWEAGEGRDISVKAQAGYLLDWLDELEVKRAVLAGHDVGGGVAQIVAVRARERVAGLVLSNSIAYDSWPIAPVKVTRALGPLTSRTPPALLKRQLALFLRPGHDSAERARESFEAHWPGYEHPRGAAALVRQMKSLRTEDTLEIADRLPELELPAAIVWGAADRFQPIDYGERLALDLGAPLDYIPGARHFVPENHPERMAAAIERVVGEAG
jgi:pimeloyl-ACP methyl ester carboxylesterase